MKSVPLFTIAGLRITAHPTAFLGALLLWMLLTLVGERVFNLPQGEAIAGALIAMLLHYASELWHQIGHAWAAQRVGYPMIGVRYWWILGASIYPKNEPALPGRIHIQRALGGPLFSLIVGAIFGVLYLVLRDSAGTIVSLLLAFLALDNLLVFGLGAFLPLGFTDGSTILRWWGK